MLRSLSILGLVTALAACGKPAPGPSRPAAQAQEGPADPIKECDDFIAASKIDKSKSDWRTHLPKPPQFRFDPDRQYFWRIETNHGPIRIKLMPKVAPMHVSSTIYLSRVGFYDDLLFHRVIPDFMAQGGCPLGTGSGSPGYRYDGEFDPAVRHDRPGLLSMANGGPGTDGSQFFITFRNTPRLDGIHTIFGEVVEGSDTLKELEKRGTRSSRGETTERLEMTKTSIEVQ